jgi:hypothetical protein
MRLTTPLGTPCRQCGEVHERCAAHTRAGRPCRRHHAPGIDVCRTHGAAAPAAKAKSERFLAERAAAESIADVVVLPVENPLEALAEVAAEALAFQRFAAAKVADLDTLEDASKINGLEYLRPLVALYERSIDRSAKLLADWVRLGFDERMVAMSERQAAIVAQVLRSVLDDPELGLDDEAKAVGRTVAARHLRAVAA